MSELTLLRWPDKHTGRDLMVRSDNLRVPSPQMRGIIAAHSTMLREFTDTAWALGVKHGKEVMRDAILDEANHISNSNHEGES